MFDIKIVKGIWELYHENDEDPERDEWPEISRKCHGEITIGECKMFDFLSVDYVESFPVYEGDSWTIEMYVAQWSAAVKRILDAKVSVLMVSRSPLGFQMWPMFKFGEIVRFQNQHLMYGCAKEIFGREFDISKEFDLEYVLGFVFPCEEKEGGGHSSTELIVNIGDIRDFWQRKCAGEKWVWKHDEIKK